MDSRAPDSRIGIAGAGRIAQAMGRLLCDAGQPLVAIAGRDRRRTAVAAAFIGGRVEPVSVTQLPELAGRVLVAVPDRAVGEVAVVLAEAGMHQGAALHTSGARGPEALQPLIARGVSCGTLHPLQTVATPEQGVRALPGAAYSITADGEAARWAAEIVKLLEGVPLIIAADCRPLFHAAAVLASNHLVGLIDAATSLMEAAGVERDRAREALAPLVGASVDNAFELGPSQALTGPIMRGDVATVAAHWEALARAPASIRETYRALALHLLALARRGGLGRTEADQIAGVLRGPENAKSSPE